MTAASGAAHGAAPFAALGESARRIAHLAWPTLVGQVAVVAFGTVDTVLVAHHSALDLAALAIGGAAYITVFIGLMGVVMAVGPIAGRLYGAGRRLEAGRQLQQSMWLAALLSVVGAAALLWPQPFLRLSHASPEVAERARGYLAALACALPAALLFAAYRGFNTAVSRPKAVMALQVAALAAKLPLSALLVYGAEWPALGLRVPSLGAPGCGIATAIVLWLQWLAALAVLRRDPFYRPLGLGGRIGAPRRAPLAALLRLGLPMGLSIMVEVSGFTCMAFFISRLGDTPVAGHQIAANLVALLFMVPLSIGNAASALAAQRLGAGDAAAALRIAGHALALGIGVAALVATVVGLSRAAIVDAYTDDPAVAAAALPLVAWVALFHVVDAAQCIAAFALRAWRIAALPVAIYAIAVWGIGIGGGHALAFDAFALTPAALRGAPGFWAAASAGLLLAALSLGLVLARLRSTAAGRG